MLRMSEFFVICVRVSTNMCVCVRTVCICAVFIYSRKSVFFSSLQHGMVGCAFLHSSFSIQFPFLRAYHLLKYSLYGYSYAL